MKKTLFTFVMLFSINILPANGEEINFLSPSIEESIRQHLGLPESIAQDQLDTITTLDLSRKGIVELRDLLHLPNIKRLNLAYNNLECVEPLQLLTSLEYLNLRGNNLEDVSPLSFSHSEMMTVDVSMNYIQSFDLFQGYLDCQFSIIGMGWQSTKNETYLDVMSLCTHIDDEGLPVIRYNVRTNATNQLSLLFGDETYQSDNDEQEKKVSVPAMPNTTTPVVLSAGSLSDTTYIVPPIPRLISAGGTRCIRLDLPDSYEITSVYAEEGNFDFDGLTVTYTAPETFEGGELELSFSKNYTVRGYTTIPFVKGLLGDVDQDNDVDDYDLQTLVGILTGKIDISGKARSSINLSLLAADLTGDGQIDVADITALVNILHPAAEE